MKKLLAAALLLSLYNVAAAQDYPLSAIPDSLKTNANAVIRSSSVVVNQSDLNNATISYSSVITVLNEQGKEYATVFIPQDKFYSLQSFSAVILSPESGKVVKKISKSDLSTFAYSSALVSDDKYSVYEYQPSGYPFTIKYEYELRMKNGIASYPRFIPVTGYNVAVQQASYTLHIPTNITFKSRVSGLKQKEPIVETKGQTVSHAWRIENFCALKSEPLSPDFTEVLPMVMAVPHQFCKEDHCGSMDSWTTLGAWLSQLLQGRGDLPADVKAKLLELTKDAKTDREKVKLVYEHLQATTRYVSIQLGIGGYQPIPAADVAKSGWGDCKALSNYMKAMLEAVGIPSVYTAISTDVADLYDSFANFNQLNHAILMVPLKGDTLWLECTSSTTPFGYTHNSIAGHEALLVMEDSSRLCRLSKPDTCGSRTNTINLKLHEDGNATAHVSSTYKLMGFEWMEAFVGGLSADERQSYLLKKLKGAKAQLTNLTTGLTKSESPSSQLSYDVNIDKYANKTNSRLMVPLTPLKFDLGETTLLSRNGERKQQVEIEDELLRVDTLRVEIPDSYALEGMPKPVTINSDFGSFSMSLSLNGQVLQVMHRFFLKPGKYPASAAAALQAFLKSVEKEVSRTAVFKVKG